MKFSSVFTLAGAIINALGVAAAPARSAASGPNVVYNTHWSGAVLNSRGVTNVQGSFVIPRISGQPSQESVAVWVGIDGTGGGNCGNTLMQAGILLYGDGSISRK